ncbi:histidinol-phosphate transaminase [Aeoliella sp. ICT_H6.2]|uniref:Histidinol-phosphate aminotransferase n=1 Tax=Aeoliella straminimaris TaxID=2954799 RepID=A0A9X2FJP1_9BACT|nr:histidinol-phosphate transaminase [Aeoliella straminimaris]MCO6047581.1 histidinol-phosphate transaminase [Aeoliella straminimaris]
MFREAIQQMTGYTPGEQPRREKVIKLNTNENAYPPSPRVVAAIEQAAAGSLQKYPDPVATAFRERAAEVLRSDLPEITPEWILCGNGSDDILTILTRTFVGEGDVLRYPNPSYVLYKTLAEIQGASVDVVDFAPDWTMGDEFAVPVDRLRLAYLANPNSPSGTVVPAERVASLAAAMPCPLVVDEAYGDFADTNCLGLVAENERVIVTRTLSKSYALAGIRFGFAIAQPKVIEQLAKVKDSYNCDMLAIAAATAAIDDQPWLADNRAKVLATRGRMITELRAKGFTVTDSQANFVWCTDSNRNLKELYESLKQMGVLVRYMPYPGWPEGIRVTVGTDEQVDALLALV